MINRYYNRQPLTFDFYKPNVQATGQAMEFMQKKYDTNVALADQLSANLDVNALPSDVALANTKSQEYKDQLDQMVIDANGDFSILEPKLKAFRKKIAYEYTSPKGVMYNIAARRKGFDEWEKRQIERVNKKEILADDVALARQYILKNDKGVGDYNPNTGGYNQFHADEVPVFVNINDIYGKLKFTPKEVEIGTTTFKDGKIIKNTSKQSYIDPQEAEMQIRSAYEGDPNLLSYIKWKAQYGAGVPADKAGDVAFQILNADAMQRAANVGGVQTKSDKEDIQYDDLYLARYKNKLEQGNIRLRQQLQNEAAASAFDLGQNPYRWDPASDKASAASKAIDPENWRSVVQNPFKVSEFLAANTLPGGSAIYAAEKIGNAMSGKNSSYTGDLKTFIHGKDIESTNVNQTLSRKIFEDMNAKTDYSKLGNLEKKNFETNFWKTYNNSSKNLQQGMSIAVPPKAAVGMLKSVIPRLLGGQESVAKEGSPVLVNSKQVFNDAWVKKYLGSDGKVDGRIGVEISPIGPGHPVAGIKLVTPDGSYVIKEQDAQLSEIFDHLSNGLSPIFTHGKPTGGQMLIGSAPDGSPVYKYPSINYTYNPTTGTYTDNLMFKDKPDDKEGMPGTLEQVYNNYLPTISKILGQGMSKTDNTPWQFIDAN